MKSLKSPGGALSTRETFYGMLKLLPADTKSDASQHFNGARFHPLTYKTLLKVYALFTKQ